MLKLFNLLPLGEAAPPFTLTEGHTGLSYALTQAVGKSLILIFYPADFTPGCTQQLCMFRDAEAVLAAQGCEVWGINPGGASSHQAFAEKHGLKFPLLSDPGMKVAKLYKAQLIPGLLQNRVVYGIDAQSVIRFAEVGNPTPEVILQALDAK
jgi:thioredoxin-dependent peroxiredoxin